MQKMKRRDEKYASRKHDEAGQVETRQPGVSVVLRHTDAALARPKATGGSAHQFEPTHLARD
jgi:hypothetical protein